MSRESVFEVLKSHFGNDIEINNESHLIDDLDGDDFDVIDIIVQIEQKLNISIPEEETFEIATVSELLEVVERHNVQD